MYPNTMTLAHYWHAQAGEVVFVVSTLVGLLLWGMGFWWLVHGVTCVAARFFFGGLKFNMGFWCAMCCVLARGTRLKPRTLLGCCGFTLLQHVV